jgi:hypothetical protein
VLSFIGVAGHKKTEAALETAWFIGEMPGIQFPRIPAMGDEGMIEYFFIDEIDDIEALIIGRFTIVDNGDDPPLFDGAVAF